MDFKELSSFVAVVKYGTFSKAAEKLFISQPTISIHIKSLEEELNTKLFKRSTKKMTITPKGQDLYEFSLKVLKLKENFSNLWDKNYDNVIRIGASTIPCSYLLPNILKDFKRDNTSIKFKILQGDSNEIVDLLSMSIIDVGLIGMDLNDKNIYCKHFYRDKMIVIAPNNSYFKELKQSKVSFDDLFEKDYILREEGSGKKLAGEKLLSNLGIDSNDLNIVAKVKSQDALINLVKRGLGISIVSQLSVKEMIDNDELVFFNLPNKSNERYLNIIYQDSSNKKVLKNFINYIKDYYN